MENIEDINKSFQHPEITTDHKHVLVKYLRTEDEIKEIEVDHVYMLIPFDYVCIYHKLLVYLADFGKSLLTDCSSACKGNNKTIIDCWNMFQSALACYNLGRLKEAEIFINYIKAQLELIYKSSDKEPYNDSFIAPVSEDGHLRGIVSCGDNIKFYVDTETGQLIGNYNENTKLKNVFLLDEKDIPVIKKCKLEVVVEHVYEPDGGYEGSATGSGTYNEGDVVRISITLRKHNSISSMKSTGNAPVKVSETEYDVTMTRDTKITIKLDVKRVLTTTISPTDPLGGYIVIDPYSIVGETIYSYGEQITVRIAPNREYMINKIDIGGVVYDGHYVPTPDPDSTLARHYIVTVDMKFDANIHVLFIKK